eukprot:1169243_1
MFLWICSTFLLAVTVSMVLLSTKIGFRRCHWLLLVLLLMRRTTKVLMKALLLIFVVAKTRQNTTGLMKKVCLVLVMSYGYGGVGVLNENIMEMKTVLLLVVMVVVISMKEKSVLFVVIRIVLSLVTLQCDIIGNAKIGFVLQSCADSHGKQELESITNCIKRCGFDCGFRQPISLCFDFGAL